MSGLQRSIKLLFFLMFVSGSAFAAVASLESNYVAGQADLIDKLNNDRTTLTNSVNNIEGCVSGGVQSAGQIRTDTLCEENMADEINPRIRTFEGASCEFVQEGLLPTTTTATLTGSIPAGTAYPRGYRIRKETATSQAFTADKWTYIDIDQDGSFQLSETAINAAVPSIATNSIRIARVSTDSTAIIDVRDLRVTNCAAASFSEIKNTDNEASLADLLESGKVRVSADAGWVRGAQVSYETVTTFTVKPGSSWFSQNDEYRFVSGNITVTQSNDNPSLGESGLDTGAIAASTKYAVYLAADEEDVASYSVTFSADHSTPSGVTNYRRIGFIRTDADTNFVSQDIVVTHEVGDHQIAQAWAAIDGTGVAHLIDSFNVSSFTDHGAGDYTFTWDIDFASTDYIAVLTGHQEGSAGGIIGLSNTTAPAVGSLRIDTLNNGSVSTDHERVNILVIGDRS